jgi:hypothetical protein
VARDGCRLFQRFRGLDNIFKCALAAALGDGYPDSGGGHDYNRSDSLEVFMTNRQAAVLTSRIFCVWFIYNAVSNLAILPNFLGSLHQGYGYSSTVAGRFASRFDQMMLMNVLADLFRLSFDIAAAIFFYRCGPWLIRFLTGSESDADAGKVEATT